MSLENSLLKYKTTILSLIISMLLLSTQYVKRRQQLAKNQHFFLLLRIKKFIQMDRDENMISY